MKLFALVMIMAGSAWAQPSQPDQAYPSITNPTFDPAQPLRLVPSKDDALRIDLHLWSSADHDDPTDTFVHPVHQTDCITLPAEALAYRYQSILDRGDSTLVIYVDPLPDCLRISAELASSADRLMPTFGRRTMPRPVLPPRSGRADNASATRVVTR
jgi:hypothetical protein